MPYRTYRDEPLILWPPESVDDPEYYTSDMPCTGVTFDSLGLWTCWQNYHGTTLIHVEEMDGTYNGIYFDIHPDGFRYITGGRRWSAEHPEGVYEDSHPDLIALYGVLVNAGDPESLDVLDDDATVDLLLDTAADFLVKRGWVRMESCDELIDECTEAGSDGDTRPVYRYWKRA